MNINDDFEHKVKLSLDADVQNLDAETRQLLVNARRNALNQPQETNWFTSWFKQEYWLPAGSLAFCSLLAVFLLVNPKPHESPANVVAAQQQSDQLAALELLDNTDDLDAATDPDFYLWANEVLEKEAKGNAV
jgi:hypothetical protein